MMECKITYTPETIQELNKSNLIPLNPNLLKFFQRFPKSKYSNVIYNNSLNKNFPTQNRKKILPKLEPFTDEKTLFDLKALLIKVNDENQATILDQILKLNFTENSIDKVAELVHEVTVNCIFLVKVYVDIILQMEEKCPKIIEKINFNIIKQLYQPKVFDPANDEFACETAEQKAKKWRINNGMLISELFLRDKYHYQFMMDKIINPLIADISADDMVNIEVLHKIIPIVGPKLELKHKLNLTELFTQLTELSANKAYPPRLRFLIMDVIDLRKKNWKN